jgi:hypothetical protein
VRELSGVETQVPLSPSGDLVEWPELRAKFVFAGRLKSRGDGRVGEESLSIVGLPTRLFREDGVSAELTVGVDEAVDESPLKDAAPVISESKSAMHTSRLTASTRSERSLTIRSKSNSNVPGTPSTPFAFDKRRRSTNPLKNIQTSPSCENDGIILRLLYDSNQE